jgi:glutathione synthase/RimK-type ligase-like ATP-grasp enzyme
MNRSILIVTNKNDIHADVVAAFLQRLGHVPQFLYSSDIPHNGSVRYRLNNGDPSSVLESAAGLVDLRAIGAVWWRKPDLFSVDSRLTENENLFARNEGAATLTGMFASLALDPSVYWMNHPWRNQAANHKIAQLSQAAQLGMRVPETLVTTDPDDVIRFQEECGPIIYKTLAFGALGDIPRGPVDVPYLRPAEHGPWIMTTIVDPGGQNYLDSVRLAPCLFQELIPKDHELRVTVIGEQVFACAIYSQENEQTKVDWRHPGVEFPRKEARLPDGVRDFCLAMTKHYGLNYGALDFIVTPAGEYVFLELNPNGQWMFVQHWLPRIPLVQTMADTLVSHAA